MTSRNAASFLGIAIVLVYAIGSGLWVNTGDGWYGNLNRPSWQPPSYLFGLIWPYNFFVLGIAAFAIGQRASKAVTLTYMVFFAISVASALVWAYQFYRPHNFTASAIALTATAVMTIPMVAILFTVSLPIALAVVPYQVWVGVAASLSWGYRALNAASM
ncbi:MAG: tryptophan-rich sensory protein [Actinobacteria bacterium]|nr:tryptophan-rich sensory protein [Actinomycetota bacterium]